jgi:hypothetical protein
LQHPRPDEPHHAPCRQETDPRECEWKQASRAQKSSRFFEDGQSCPVGLTKLAFSWKPFASERGRGTHKLSARNEARASGAYALATVLASKLAVLRNGPLSEACSSTFRGALWADLHSTSSCGQKEAVALFEGLRHFLRVARAHRPEKSLRAFMDPLADALCGAPKWLKSSRETVRKGCVRY